VAERQEQSVARRAAIGRGVDQRIGEEREAGRRLVRITVDAIGPAAPERPADALGIESEAEPALVFEAVAFGRIERDPRRIADPRGNVPLSRDAAF